MNFRLNPVSALLALGLMSASLAHAAVVDVRMSGTLGAQSSGAFGSAAGSFGAAVRPGSSFTLNLQFDTAQLGENLEFEDFVQTYEGTFFQSASLNVGGQRVDFNAAAANGTFSLNQHALFPSIGGRDQPAFIETDGLLLGLRQGGNRVSLNFVLPQLFQNLPYDFNSWSGNYQATAQLPDYFKGNWEYGSFEVDGSAGYFRASELSVSVAAIPEPASVALLLAGLGAVGLASRRRRAA